jgi:stage II sporulation protein M
VIDLNKRLFYASLNVPSDSRANYLGLLLCGALFLCGIVIGTVSAGFLNDDTKLNEFISNYLSFFSNGTSVKPGILSAIFDNFKYHICAIFLGFSVLGVFFIPILSAVRGFFLSFTISAIIRLLGGKGILLSLFIFGINTLLTVPCFFILSVSAFSASLYILRLALSKNLKNTVSPFNRGYFTNCGICLVVLMISALIDTYLTTQLISYAASHII